MRLDDVRAVGADTAGAVTLRAAGFGYLATSYMSLIQTFPPAPELKAASDAVAEAAPALNFDVT